MTQSLKNFLGVQEGVVETAAEILAKIKTVDGTGSGLDADLVDGQNLGSISTQNSNNVEITGGTITVSNVVTTDISANTGDITTLTSETITANNFIGDGSQLTGISTGITTGKAIAMAIVFGG